MQAKVSATGHDIVLLCNGKPALESNPPGACSISWVNLILQVLTTQATVI